MSVIFMNRIFNKCQIIIYEKSKIAQIDRLTFYVITKKSLLIDFF